MSLLKKMTIAFSMCIMTALLAFGVSAQHYAIDGFEIPVDVVINGSIIKTPVNAFLEDSVGTVYVPVRAMSEAIGADVSWTDETKTATVTRNGADISFSIYDESLPAVLYKDTLFVPVRAVSEKFGFNVTWDDYYYQVWISAPDVTVAEQCVDNTYYNADILLIAQVLQVECRGADFESMIAVANIITNRVASDLFPDTVREVIYDRRYGSPQFTIAYNGMLDNTPSTQCMLAAKCALDGVVVAKDCLFYQAEYVTNSWMDRNREVAMYIGGNKFFY